MDHEFINKSDVELEEIIRGGDNSKYSKTFIEQVRQEIINRHNKSEIGKLILAAIFVFVLLIFHVYYDYFGIVTGHFHTNFWDYHRDKDPFNFWFISFLLTLLIVFLFIKFIEMVRKLLNTMR
jgi:hypothetical protein